MTDSVGNLYQNNIFKLAATLYADSDSELSLKKDNIINKFIESSFMLDDNNYHSVDSIINLVQEQFYIYLSEEEVLKFIRHKTNDLDLNNCDVSKLLINYPKKASLQFCTFKLNEHRHRILSERENKFDISHIIQEFVTSYKNKFPHINKSDSYIEDLILDFIFDKFVSNFLNYEYIIESKNRFNSEKIFTNLKNSNSKYIDPTDIDIINDFLDFEDNTKNKYIFYIINLAFDYSITINSNSNGNKSNKFLNRNLFLDTNILYRALGLNNNDRKEKINLFLDKCIRNGQTLYITNITHKEFITSIEHKCNELKGFSEKISPDLFLNKVTLNSHNDDFACEYYKRKKEQKSLNPTLFEIQCKTDFSSLLKKYSIKLLSIPIENDTQTNQITNSLLDYKISRNSSSASFDLANNDILNLNYLYNSIPKNNINDNKNFFVTTDTILVSWAKESNNEYKELCLYPSDWLAFILRFIDRTEDSYKSFISFLRLNHNKKDIIDIKSMSKVLNMIDSTFNGEYDKVQFLEEFMNSSLDKIKNASSEKEISDIFEFEALEYVRKNHVLEQKMKNIEISVLNSDNKKLENQIEHRDILIDKQEKNYRSIIDEQQSIISEKDNLFLEITNLLARKEDIIKEIISDLLKLSAIFTFYFIALFILSKNITIIDNWLSNSETIKIFFGCIISTFLPVLFNKNNMKKISKNFKEIHSTNNRISKLRNSKKIS